MDEKLSNFLQEVRRSAPDQQVYLVGGAVRDLVLGRAVKDLDFVVADGSIRLAKTVRRCFDGVWYTLDDEHQTARVILKQGKPGELVLDFTAFIGGNLEEDLRQRDFTINAMAIDLDNLDVVIDPLDGQDDLRNGQLRLGNPRSLLSDPLRVLRAVRMARTFSLSPTLEIIDQLRVAIMGLNRISGERIRDELLKCLAVPDIAKTFDLMQEFGILFQLLNRVFELDFSDFSTANFSPDNDPETDDSLEKVRHQNRVKTDGNSKIVPGLLQALEDLLLTIDGNIPGTGRLEGRPRFSLSQEECIELRNLLGDSLQAGRTRKQLLILLALFFCHHPAFSSHDVETNNLDCLQFAERLTNAFMLGQKEQKFFELICAGYQKMNSLSLKGEVGSLELYRYFKAVGSFGLESAILHIAKQAASTEPDERITTLAKTIIHTWFFDHDRIVDPSRLVDGDDLQKTLHLDPGPSMGYYLESVREAQVVGEVSNRDEALALVLRLSREGCENDC